MSIQARPTNQRWLVERMVGPENLISFCSSGRPLGLESVIVSALASGGPQLMCQAPIGTDKTGSLEYGRGSNKHVKIQGLGICI